MTDVLQSDRDFIADLLEEVGGHEIDSRVIRDRQGDHKAIVQMAVNRRLAILENIKRNRIDGVASRLNVILNENEEALTVTVRGHIEAALRLCTLAALDGHVGKAAAITYADRDLFALICPDLASLIWGGDLDRYEQMQAIVRHRSNAALDSRAGDAGEGLVLPPGWKLWTGGPFAPQDYDGRYMLRNRSFHDWRAGNGAGPSWKWEYGEGDVVAYLATPAPADDAPSTSTRIADGETRTDADMLREIAKDHERLAPNAYHAAETLRQIADRITASPKEASAPAVDAVDDRQINTTTVDDRGAAVDAVPAGEVGQFVIRRNGAFFRPNAQGYTTHIVAAGFYTREEADNYANVEGVTIEPLERYRAEAEGVIDEANRLLAALSHGEGRK